MCKQADLIAVIDCDLLEDGPMMALAIRQAWRKGAKVYLVDKNPELEMQSDLPFEWERAASLSDIAFAEAKNPVIICGPSETAATGIPESLKNVAKLAILLNGPNAFGAALLADEHSNATLSHAVGDAKIKGIIAVEADIPSDLLQGVPFVAALDWQNTDAVKAARIVLPTTAWVEMDGTYINNEGRAQRFKKVMNPGLPIKGLDPELHPPTTA